MPGRRCHVERADLPRRSRGDEQSVVAQQPDRRNLKEEKKRF